MTKATPLLALALAALALGADVPDAPPASPSPAAPLVAAPPPDRIAPFVTGEEEYARLRVEPGSRIAPEAADRLVVFQGGRPVLDLGLRNEYHLVPGSQAPTEEVFEEGIVEIAEIAPDGRSAVILSTRYRRPADEGAATPELGEKPQPQGESVLTWVDAKRPEARFSVELHDGRWVREVIPLSAGNGLAVSTTRGLEAPSDLRVFGPDGRETFHHSEDEAAVTGLAASNNGGFLAASLAFPERPGFPQQGVLVLDLLHGTHWTYSWSYGGEGEPISWSLKESGVLEVRLPGRIMLYDQNGTPVGTAPPVTDKGPAGAAAK
jgi:hypothetical protein